MNKALIKSRFAKSLDTYEQQADVQLHIAQVLVREARPYLSVHCDRLLEIGCGTGFLTRELLSDLSIQQMYLNDLVDMSSRMEQLIGLDHKHTEFSFIPGDAEEINFPNHLQAVFSASSIQWFSDLPSFFSKVNDALLPEGMFLFNSFGPANLNEIKTLMGEGLYYPNADELSEMLSDFEILEMWDENLVRYFESPRAVLHHLKETGVTATHPDFRWTKSNLIDFENTYRDQFGCEVKVTLSWQIYYFICKKR
jgi:malonyl-CoA O-methyltransferase